MNLFSLIALALSFFLAMLASWALLLPFFEGEEVASAGGERRNDLLLKKETVLDALEDLNEDHQSGKISDTQFAESKRELTAQAAEILRDLEPPDRTEDQPDEQRRALKRSR